jgi:hypothetical protein
MRKASKELRNAFFGFWTLITLRDMTFPAGAR